MPTDPPLWQNTLTSNGLQLRRADALLVMSDGTALGARGGVRPGSTGLTVSLSGTTINVSAGGAFAYRAGQGVYRAVLPSAWTGTLAAAHATYFRIDLVYLRIWDTDVDSSGLRQGDVVYLPGTASATPPVPSPGANEVWVPLAQITVPRSGGGAPSVDTSVRPVTVAPGGILPGQAGVPAGAYPGMYWDDGSDLRRYTGSAVETMQKVESVAWTTPSTLGNGYTQGSDTLGNANGPIRYRTYTDRGTQYMEWDGGGTRTAGAQNTNILNAALPTILRPKYRASFSVPRNAAGIAGVSGSGSVVNSVKVDFNQDGTVGLVTAAAGDSETSWFSLRGIRYPLS
ncbi:hypothetical protein ACF09J_07630 [Streptomyces sp. NPDC014889]|uniref:hypothetical protein n=1 Tax=Streptomyces sp. NPDC014889 TaxID=3364928 RepID=UPI0036F89102